jgi:hypothetical protein
MNYSTSALSLLLTLAPLAAQITPGNLVVLRVSTGSSALSSAATAAFLDQYDQNGVLVGTIALPTAPSGSNLPLTNSGTATSEGFLTQSVDGNYLICAGYGTTPGTGAVSGTTAATVNRVIARIGLDGVVDTSTALSDAYSAGTIRSATSWDGEEFWTAGTATASNGPGVRYVDFLGATTSTQLSTSVTNTRVVGIHDDQLYVSSASGAFQGVSTVGVGLPMTSGETITPLPGFPTTTGPSAYDFFFADATTLYVADDRTNGSGGIQKWSFNGTTWTLAYTLANSATTGCRGLSGFVANGTATLFATTTNNLLVKVTDLGAGPLSPFTQLAAGVTNTAMRGVRFVRTPASLTLSGTPCATSAGVPGIFVSGLPIVGNANFAIVGDNAPPATVVMYSLKLGAPLGFGIPVPGTPPCIGVYVLPDVLLTEFADVQGFSSTALPIPNDLSLTGTVLSAQAFPFDLTLVGFALPIGSTEAIEFTIGN